MKRRGKLHYGWIVVFASLVLAGLGSGVFASTLGVFVKPICDELGFARGQFMLYSTIYFIVNVALMSVFGSMFQRFGFRRVSTVCVIGLSLALFGYSFSRQLWQFYACAFFSGLFINGISLMAVGILVGRWFIAQRGLASGIAYSGSGLMAAALLPICNRFIEAFGWSWTFRFLGVFELALALPIILFIIRDKPEDMGTQPFGAEQIQSTASFGKGAASLNTGLTRRQALRTPSFWLLFTAITGIALCMAGANSNTVTILSDVGYSAGYAATVSSAYMVVLTICKVSIGHVLDRIGPLKGALLIGGSCVLFPIVALFNRFPVAPWIYIFFLAIAGSGCSVLGTVLTSEYFGRKDYSRIYSIIAMATQLGAAFSTPLLGFIYDHTGGYDLAWYLFATLAVGVCLLLVQSHRASKSIRFTE